MTGPDVPRPQTSTRDHGELRQRFEHWLATQLPPGADPRVASLDVPASNGLSSETVMVDVSWSDGHESRREALVARLAPAPDAVPVFPVYDLDRQARIMRLVREHSPIPVPAVRWSEPDPEPLGTPFFVMERIDGQVPPDLMPYNMLGWVTDATDAQRATMQEATVGVLAAIHGIDDAESVFDFLREGRGGSALDRHIAAQRDYTDWVVRGTTVPVVERLFAWLDERRPHDVGPTVLSWGDARIGNVMYRDFTPVAVLDWEMAALAPPEVDIGWLVYMHRYFEFVAHQYGLPGLPDLLRPDDVVREYERVSGYAPRDLDWYVAYAALRHAVIMARIQRRAIRFGEALAPGDPDELVAHRLLLEEILASA